MSFETKFRVLVCSQLIHAQSQEATHLRAISDELRRREFAVVESESVDDAAVAIRSDAALGCMLLNGEPASGSRR